ncbi:CHAT domain-containing protein [Anabaena cylindrica FACHB-243]|uniref:Tetratricopeptide TPR_2 repeat-containing protein n=1 Tax=Anabaena cylindrica (strain ATCC 27899 / PCC 7122) TaxID=272123 RepID=K9ZB27_ANACC|nr:MULTISPECIES: CHAT domain-containing protein [Anabaena]AFZ55787.1 Tetratricopeptide TPR_2 repeat-containing protein [Anabaena cylindrica PCC 7122]MBD2420211.1 CHAT domain-containing protein [Anabaena cylindrica FACHB-243]MBY5283082.1 CHAT domain-containing protein [Anabaena sp. CCAP 1446/1C]MBY5307799.1 CHAT domain-containing protein [Anabaena sp. CCAP 1446/1C]MCM2406137.1 CHAT domain-containing protein [Anabaena sp. CCAP 1446/1C]
MAFRIKQTRWLYAGLSILSLLLVFFGTPVKASPTVTTTPIISASQATNGLEQGRNLYRAGRFTEAITAWQTAAQQYQTQGDRLNEALSLSYLSLAQQEMNQWEPAQNSIEQSLKILQRAKPAADAIIWAQTLNTQASLHLRTGKAETAIENWQQAQKYYEQAGDTTGSLGSQINQAQALQSLGFYRRSRQQLETLTQKLAAMPDSEVKVSGLRSLGWALQAIGDDKSQQVLEQSLETANKIQAKTQLSSILLSLGKNASHLQNPETALNYFDDAQQAAANPNEELQARLAQFKLLIDYDKLEYAIPLAPQLRQQLAEIPPSHDSLYAAINFVATLNQLAKTNEVLPNKDLAELMAVTVKSAQKIQDAPAEAHALYQLGQLYIRTQQWSESKKLAEKSLNIARQLQADDIIAQAAWQVGKLYKQEGNKSAAITAYTEAVNSLKALRGDMVAVNPDVQFSFRESVEPVYRELVGLLLDEQPTQAELIQARELIESLQVAELDNFFREACLDKAQQIDKVDPTATVIYPIILSDRLAVILSQTGKPLRYYVTQKSQAEIEQTLNNLFVALNPVSDSKERQKLTEQIYDWLIRPAEQEKAFQDTKTLVFVLDGKLRNIPMAALYDGKQYLIEKYAIALSPGLQLMAAHPLQQNKINAIVGGISKSRAGFSALPAVESEVKQISKSIPSQVLLNQEFTNQSFGDRIKSANIDVVHLATHGQFSSRLEDTYLLTWDGRISVNELSELLKNRGGDSSKAIELLVLSACDTATGDDRAVLGLAGLAVKSGARSTIATLWPVKDKAAEILMTRFYEQLRQPKITKAEALRQAQINVIRQTDFHDPFFWSTFVLVGNWN